MDWLSPDPSLNHLTFVEVFRAEEGVPGEGVILIEAVGGDEGCPRGALLVELPQKLSRLIGPGGAGAEGGGGEEVRWNSHNNKKEYNRHSSMALKLFFGVEYSSIRLLESWSLLWFPRGVVLSSFQADLFPCCFRSPDNLAEQTKLKQFQIAIIDYRCRGNRKRRSISPSQSGTLSRSALRSSRSNTKSNSISIQQAQLHPPNCREAPQVQAASSRQV